MVRFVDLSGSRLASRDQTRVVGLVVQHSCTVLGERVEGERLGEDVSRHVVRVHVLDPDDVTELV